MRSNSSGNFYYIISSILIKIFDENSNRIINYIMSQTGIFGPVQNEDKGEGESLIQSPEFRIGPKFS